MHRSDSRRKASRGSVLPVTLIVLILLVMTGVAGFEAARFAKTAATGQLAAAAALHAADTGLAAYTLGTGSAVGSFRLRASWGEAHVTAEPLVSLSDSSVIVLVESSGFAPAESAAVGRRYLAQLTRIGADGSRHRVRGTWNERM